MSLARSVRVSSVRDSHVGGCAAVTVIRTVRVVVPVASVALYWKLSSPT
jgi:hypothetical protein